MSEGVGRDLYVLTICGVGMGSSLMLRMTAEEALRELGVGARVEARDLSSVRSLHPDIIIGQGVHTAEIENAAPIAITVTNFLDRDGIRRELQQRLREAGWIT